MERPSAVNPYRAVERPLSRGRSAAPRRSPASRERLDTYSLPWRPTAIPPGSVSVPAGSASLRTLPPRRDRPEAAVAAAAEDVVAVDLEHVQRPVVAEVEVHGHREPRRVDRVGAGPRIDPEDVRAADGEREAGELADVVSPVGSLDHAGGHGLHWRAERRGSGCSGRCSATSSRPRWSVRMTLLPPASAITKRPRSSSTSTGLLSMSGLPTCASGLTSCSNFQASAISWTRPKCRIFSSLP